MRQNELISVVIPCYNRRGTLPACLASVLAQSYRNLEVLVVDDGSTDGTAALFAEPADPRVRYLRYEENRGACYARNYGAARARGVYLAFQDSDDTWRPEKLARELALLRRTGADLVFCAMERVAPDGARYTFPVHPFHPERALEELLAENRVGTQTMLLRRGVWEALRFDESFRRYQDWDFAIRAAAAFRLAYLPEVLADSPVGSDSISFAVRSYPALVRLHEKHAALYARYPKSDAVMHRRMAKRLRSSDPAAAAAHDRAALRLGHGCYDLARYLADARAARRQRRTQS